MLNRKTQELLNYLSDSPSYVTLEELMQHFNISRRTVFNRLKEINSYLLDNGFEEITNTPRLGYHLKSLPNLQGLKKDQKFDNLTKKERISKELWELVDGKIISINKLALEYNCTRNTIISDFKVIQSENPTLKLTNTNKGKFLISNEEEIRKIVLKYIQLKDPIIMAELQKLKYDKDYKLVVRLLSKKLNVILTEKTINHIANYMKFMTYRVTNGKVVKSVDRRLASLGLKDFLPISKDTLDKIFPNIEFLDGEAELLGEIIASSQALNIDVSDDSLDTQFENLSREIIFRFIQVTTSPINMNPILLKMLKNHLYSTYFRTKLDFPFYSSEIERIRTKYSEIIKYTKVACRPLEKFLGKKLPDSEIALISLYLGAINYSDSFLEKPSEKLKNALVSDVLIVCSSGIGTSAILHNELAASYPTILFSPPLEIRELYKIRDLHGALKAKLILTTTPINSNDFSLPVRQINAILSKKDKGIVSDALNTYVTRLYQMSETTTGIADIMDVISSYADIKDYSALKDALTSMISPESNNEVDNSKQLRIVDLMSQNDIIFSKESTIQRVIEEGTSVLERKGVVTKDYLSEINRLISQYGNYMHLSNGVFLAHAEPQDGVLKTGLSLVISRKGIPLSDGSVVKLVFVLAPGTSEEHSKALSEIVSIARSKEKVQAIVDIGDKSEVYQYLYFNI